MKMMLPDQKNFRSSLGILQSIFSKSAGFDGYPANKKRDGGVLYAIRSNTDALQYNVSGFGLHSAFGDLLKHNPQFPRF